VPDLPILAAIIPTVIVALACGLRGGLTKKSRRRDAAGLLGLGFAKLLLLALPLAPLIDACINAHPLARGGWPVWMALLAVTSQCVLLVSGTADILRALGLWLGGMPPEITRAPFASDTFSGLWQRFCHPLRKRFGIFAGMALFLATMLLANGMRAGAMSWVALHLTLPALERLRGGRSLVPSFVPLPLRAVFVILVFFLSSLLLISGGMVDAWNQWQLMFGLGVTNSFTLLLDARLSTDWPLCILWLSVFSALTLTGLRRFWSRHRWTALAGGGALGLAALIAGPPLNDWPAWSAQQALVSRVKYEIFSEGGSRVVAGAGGWLYDAAELDRSTRSDTPEGFAAAMLALQERLAKKSATLLVVPVPGKLALHPEPVLPAKYAAPLQPHGLRAILERLRAAGAQVIDPAQTLWDTRRRRDSYFRRDSHWTPETMKETALIVAKHIRRHWPRLANDETPLINATIIEREHAGDLALRLAHGNAEWFEPEHATLLAIKGLDSSRDSPVLLAGGDLLRVYDDPALSFGNSDGIPQSAGFAQQLSALLARPLDVADEAELLADTTRVSEKQLVIWLLHAWRL